jgi:dGTPase
MLMPLEGYLDCLKNKRTPDRAIRRKLPFEKDEDNWKKLPWDRFRVDFSKIDTSKAIRRLDGKTQVITDHINGHVYDRSDHTRAVLSVASYISGFLGLNVDLTEAGALGHDIGHTPFGHLGENFISAKTGKKFKHATFGVIVAQNAERHGEGLNLSHQVLEIILNHSGDVQKGISEEAKVVKYSDKISFTLADYNDVFRRTRILDINNFPEINRLINLCGTRQKERLEYFVNGLLRESAEKGEVSFETSKEAILFKELKRSMYSVYHKVNILNCDELLERVYNLLSHQEQLIEGVDPAIVLALMTDNEVLYLAREKCVNGEDFFKCSASEIVSYLKGKHIDITDPGLDW